MLFLKPKIELNHSAFLAAHLLGGFWRGRGMDRVGSGRRPPRVTFWDEK